MDAMTRACEVANQALAHRTRKESKALTTPEADDAFQAIEDCLKDYYALLHGVSFSAEPTAQFDTLEVFTFPWIERSTEDQ